MRAIEVHTRRKAVKVELKRLTYQNYHSNLCLIGLNRARRDVVTDVKLRKLQAITGGIMSGMVTRENRKRQLKTELRYLFI